MFDFADYRKFVSNAEKLRRAEELYFSLFLKKRFSRKTKPKKNK
jgi:hypothetical protein